MVERIRKLCEEKYTTFGALEKKLGFANGSLRKTDEKIQAVRLKTLADYFGVSMEYILIINKKSPPNHDVKGTIWGHFRDGYLV